ncbi:hypothetical protein COT72_05065 [archaeon CG10_big_fil_rev_8_21_14_0_10_43_11]|nr:MAG: hypothetical protein COT72_05065 [archaeon CG10_big_fil_rev_8_21_14_0_10_43_11]
MRIVLRSNPLIEFPDLTVHCDGNKGDINFMSHAHSDHVFARAKNVLSSEQTLALASERFKRFAIEHYQKEDARFSLLDNGHVLGSKALLVKHDKRVLYTSDFTLKSRNFLKGFRPPKAEVLIIESTFGKPHYEFPDFNAVMREARDRIDDELKKGKHVSLIGYALGKAQHLMQLAGTFGAVSVEKGIGAINDVYRKQGVMLPEHVDLGSRESEVSVIPNPRFAQKKSVTLGFSGWAADGYYAMSRGVNDAFMVSDHADFYELVKTVKKVSPEKVFVWHGFSEEFAAFLRVEGFDAVALQKNQHMLANFH